MNKFELPVYYENLAPWEKKVVREQYIKQQDNKCMHCGGSLDNGPPDHITCKPINWNLFPKGFLEHPIHLQHDHSSGLTEGAVHAYCNAVLWQYYGR